jgi:L-alanine-DL-glutamate epimerase-like enolase superfamily enzyme
MHVHSLPLAAPLTAGAISKSREVGILRLELAQVRAGAKTGAILGVVEGLGEVAPLPGLHKESWQAAASQVAALSELLCGQEVPADLALLQGQVSAWWRCHVHLLEASLMPSVRFAVECALVDALASQQGRPFGEHVAACALGELPNAGLSKPMQQTQQCQGTRPQEPSAMSLKPQEQKLGGRGTWLQQPCTCDVGSVVVNGLLDTDGGKVQDAPSRARLLVKDGYTTLKVKV